MYVFDRRVMCVCKMQRPTSLILYHLLLLSASAPLFSLIFHIPWFMQAISFEQDTLSTVLQINIVLIKVSFSSDDQYLWCCAITK